MICPVYSPKPVCARKSQQIQTIIQSGFKIRVFAPHLLKSIQDEQRSNALISQANILILALHTSLYKNPCLSISNKP